jgi:FkbM family methyltransferase
MKKTEHIIRHLFGGYVRGSFSQQKQDRWISDVVFSGKTDGFFVEIGAHDGISISNTYYLEKFKNWRGVLIEPNQKLLEKAKKVRSAECLNCAISDRNGKVEFIPDGAIGRVASSEEKSTQTIEVNSSTLKKALENVEAPEGIDYLSVDVEGHENEVFFDFPLRDYEISAVTIEDPEAQLRRKLRKSGYLKIIEVPKVDCLYVKSEIKNEIMQGFTNINWSYFEFKMNGIIESIYSGS